jgi:hypothetical protein
MDERLKQARSIRQVPYTLSPLIHCVSVSPLIHHLALQLHLSSLRSTSYVQDVRHSEVLSQVRSAQLTFIHIVCQESRLYFSSYVCSFILLLYHIFNVPDSALLVSSENVTPRNSLHS